MLITALATLAAAFTIHVNMEFDASIKSNLVKRTAMYEAAAIWRPYGIDLQWAAVPTSDLCLDVVVERSRLHGAAAPILAQTRISSTDVVAEPIRISYDTVDELVAARTVERAGPHDVLVGSALGRVLAHEVGHVLLGSPGYHESDGLMRASFPADDLARPERARFQLSAFSIARLRSRVAALVGGNAAATCPMR